MKGERYNSADLIGALRVGDRVKTNKDNKIVMANEYEGEVLEVKAPGLWLLDVDGVGEWNFEGATEGDDVTQAKGYIEMQFMATHGCPNKASMDEIIKLRKLETEVKSMMGK